ncbi:MAG: hypothetical protein ACSHWS_06215 [Sulfitobacter sp.]
MTTLAARNQLAQDYVAAFNAQPTGTFIKNVATTLTLHQWGSTLLPMTINSGEANRTFVCCPRIGWIDFTRAELSHFPNKYLVPPLRAVITFLSALTAMSDLDRIVHINNWMMSTNLPSGIKPNLSATQTADLVAQFPTHILAMRSLNYRQSSALMKALENVGWFFLPTRQVFLVDDVKAENLSRRDSKNDARLWDRKTFAYEELTDMTASDAARIAYLYDLLYLQKYSTLNPHYSAEFIAMSHRIGLLRYLTLRDEDGVIQAFGGMHHLRDHATMPLLGYNTAMDRTVGLYRLACHAGSLYAARHNLHLNMSSGATLFKTTRGATPEIEYTGFYVRHLPLKRRLPFGGLRAVAKYIGIPLLRRYNL